MNEPDKQNQRSLLQTFALVNGGITSMTLGILLTGASIYKYMQPEASQLWLAGIIGGVAITGGTYSVYKSIKAQIGNPPPSDNGPKNQP